MLPKPKRSVDQDYLTWIRTQECALTGIPWHQHMGRVEAAHMKSRGSGGSDRTAIPLCTGGHNEQHRWGIGTWASHYEVKVADLVKRYNEQYERRI